MSGVETYRIYAIEFLDRELDAVDRPLLVHSPDARKLYFTSATDYNHAAQIIVEDASAREAGIQVESVDRKQPIVVGLEDTSKNAGRFYRPLDNSEMAHLVRAMHRVVDGRLEIMARFEQTLTEEFSIPSD